jgi:hypothetical protein
MRALRTTIIVLAITAGIYTAVDYLVGIWHRHHLDMSFLEGSPAYRGQPYATEAFIREKTLEPGQWLKIPDQALLAPTTFHGDFFNVDELPPTGIPYRRTINPPADARPERIVLLVGGSTVYGRSPRRPRRYRQPALAHLNAQTRPSLCRWQRRGQPPIHSGSRPPGL